MNDNEVEDLLRRHRPAGPPAELRGRIVGGAAVAPMPTWPWAVAAAALLALVIGLRASTDRLYRAIEDVTRVERDAAGDPPGTRASWR